MTPALTHQNAPGHFPACHGSGFRSRRGYGAVNGLLITSLRVVTGVSTGISRHGGQNG